MDTLDRAFFQCRDCGFKFSLLGAQAKYEPETCPCCQGDVGYMSTLTRDRYIKDLQDELKYIDE